MTGVQTCALPISRCALGECNAELQTVGKSETILNETNQAGQVVNASASLNAVTGKVVSVGFQYPMGRTRPSSERGLHTSRNVRLRLSMLLQMRSTQHRPQTEQGGPFPHRSKVSDTPAVNKLSALFSVSPLEVSHRKLALAPQ